MCKIPYYTPTTFEEAKEKGSKSKAKINGVQYTGFIYQGYFYHHMTDIGNGKILVKYCTDVEMETGENNG